uniref:Transmembrane protein 150A n=1 Tax=Taeniopygia guttata TaxID=59729 RepID=A0A674GRG0_TAEGU
MPWHCPTTTSALSTTGVITSRVTWTAPAPAAHWITSPWSGEQPQGGDTGRAALRPLQGNPRGCPAGTAKHTSQCPLSECSVGLACPHSKCGTLPPESCFFSLICSLGSFMVILVGLLRYAHLLERLGPSLLNTLGLATGWVCAAGLTMVGNFQVDHAKVLHYIGAGVAFPTSMLFLLLQSILTYRMAKTRGQYWTGHLRSILTTVAFFTLVFSGVFFIQESFVLQHVAALCEWMFIIDVLVFYGTFTFEFGAISTDTFLVLLKASRAPKSYKGESSLSSTAHIHSHVEGLAMA